MRGNRAVPTFLALFAALAACLALAACGFRPVHGEDSRAGPAALAQVDIDIIADRTGQMLRNELLERFHARGAAPSQPFRLQVEVTETERDLAIRKDEVATRASLTLNARYTLVHRADSAVATRGRTRSTSSYNILSSDFATLSAQSDARRRGVRQLAGDIEERISVWFLQTGGTMPQPPADAGKAR